LVGAVACCGSPTSAAEGADPKGIEFFEAKIRPVLVKSCYECHSAKAAKVKGGLLLDTKAGIRKGGDSDRPAVVPGNVERSLLIKSLRHDGLKMPPKEKLSEEVVADFVHWIKLGAPDPRQTSPAAGYKKLTLEEARQFWSFQPPRKTEPPKARNLAWPKSDIDRFILAKLEEKGLKPAADAEPRVLIRRLSIDLLGLPPTPEEVAAFEQSAIRNPQSAIEQLVDRLLTSPHFGERWGRHWLDVARYAESNGGDGNHPFPHAWRYRDYVIAAVNQDKPYDCFITEQIAGDLLPAENMAQRDEQLVATGFLALTNKPRNQQDPNFKMDLVADQIDVTGRAVLGLSVLCARCHDHKFDPISTKEYYALAGIFDSTTMLWGSESQGNKGPSTANLHVLSDQGTAMGVKDAKAVDSAICIGGEAKQRGDTVPRGFLTAATIAKPPAINTKQSGRLELARWLTQAENPLTARVAVNRIWMHLFGRGLVRTVDNFGVLGESPSHPELLDSLAMRFMEGEPGVSAPGASWSVKKMIRTIVLSRTYQLSSAHDAANFKADPDNIFLWRMSPRRLDAESLRDAMLAVSGQLERNPPQGSLAPLLKPQGNGYVLARPDLASREPNHRGIYLGIVRGVPLPESLSLFDVANPNLVVAQREITTVPAQALYLMNSPFAVEQSRHLAERLLALPDLDDPGRVDRAYQLALARPATATERERAVLFIRKRTPATGDKADVTGWALFCQALLACAEFRYVE
jgi:hypothetical protein